MRADSLDDRLAVIHARIAEAARRAGRNPDAVTIVAVSKTIPVQRLGAAIESGIRDLGENRVQEAQGKVEVLGHDIAWHLIGHVQRNKARIAVELFDLIHSVDSLELATVLDRHANALHKRQRVLFQVNISGEESKSGFTPDDLRAAAPRLAALPHLSPEGLMTIAPLGAPTPTLREVFGALRMLHETLAPLFADTPWEQLSMGMSDDFEIAVEEGTTLVRIGRALFGERSSPLPVQGG